MTDFRPIFERLGLQQYIERFAAEGFETWEVILDITESDLDALRVKLGHRRILQREIASVRAVSADRWVPINSPSASQVSRDSGSLAPEDLSEAAESETIGSVPRKKRRYRRHPKPDENAPDRPPSAYVVFSNKVREDLKGQNLSFSEIAKLVGERWQVLSADEKKPFESQALFNKERFHREMTAYKNTPSYREYQQYLVDFKQRYGSSSDGVRPRLEYGHSTASSTDPGSGAEGPSPSNNTGEQLVKAPDESNQHSIPAYSRDAHQMNATAISRPSSVSMTSPLQDAGLQYGQFLGRSADSPWSQRLDQPAETSRPRSTIGSNAQQMAAQPNSFHYISPTPSSPPPLNHEFQVAHSRRRLLGPTDHVPSFRHQDSSLSSVISSQSSTSTAATSNSVYRNAEDESHPYVTLPPISAVTGITREAQRQDALTSWNESPMPGTGASAGGAGGRPMLPTSSDAVAPTADWPQSATAFGSVNKDVRAYPSRHNLPPAFGSSSPGVRHVPHQETSHGGSEAPDRLAILAKLAEESQNVSRDTRSEEKGAP